MSESEAASVRWPKWLIGVSSVVAIPLVFQALFGFMGMPHSMEAVVVLIAVLAGAAVVGLWALIGVLLLIARPAHRTLGGYVAVVLAIVVCSLVFVPSGLLR